LISVRALHRTAPRREEGSEVLASALDKADEAGELNVGADRSPNQSAFAYMPP
jgi:hypothetical protein